MRDSDWPYASAPWRPMSNMSTFCRMRCSRRESTPSCGGVVKRRRKGRDEERKGEERGRLGTEWEREERRERSDFEADERGYFRVKKSRGIPPIFRQPRSVIA